MGLKDPTVFSRRMQVSAGARKSRPKAGNFSSTDGLYQLVPTVNTYTLCPPVRQSAPPPEELSSLEGLNNEYSILLLSHHLFTRYPIHIGLNQGYIRPLAPHGLPPNVTTLAQILLEQGYHTRAVGESLALPSPSSSPSLSPPSSFR